MSDMITSDMTKIIYDKVNLMNNNNDTIKINELYQFSNDKHIPRTQNLNGIFINLSVLDIKYIQLLFNYVKHYNYNNNFNQNLLIENQFNQYKTILSDINNKQIINKKLHKKKIKYKTLKINELEKKILSFSY